jgi:hypothetical protein
VIEAAALDVIVLAQEHYVIGAAAQSARQCWRQAMLGTAARMTASGHSRPIDTPRTVAARPLRAESGQLGRHHAKSALCHEPTYAVQQIARLPRRHSRAEFMERQPRFDQIPRFIPAECRLPE